MFKNVFFEKDLVLHKLKFGKARSQIREELKGKDSFIPRKIHYVWCGENEMPQICKRCLDSWIKYLPEWEFVLWNEDNFPLDDYPFAKEALNQKNYAMVSDVIRLYALYTYGGVYMDTDVELIKSFDSKVLSANFFACYERPNLISTATLGAIPLHPVLKMLLDWYKMVNYDSRYHQMANTRIISKIFRKNFGIKLTGEELDVILGMKIFESDYFCPEIKDGIVNVSNRTYAIHHYTGLWK